jgi:hypothetical protein
MQGTFTNLSFFCTLKVCHEIVNRHKGAGNLNTWLSNVCLYNQSHILPASGFSSRGTITSNISFRYNSRLPNGVKGGQGLIRARLIKTLTVIHNALQEKFFISLQETVTQKFILDSKRNP